EGALTHLFLRAPLAPAFMPPRLALELRTCPRQSRRHKLTVQQKLRRFSIVPIHRSQIFVRQRLPRHLGRPTQLFSRAHSRTTIQPTTCAAGGSRRQIFFASLPNRKGRVPGANGSSTPCYG